MNDSCKDGRDSWFVNLVFGKIEDVVAAAKLWWQAEVVLPDLDSLFSVACKLRSGVGQQPLRALLYTSIDSILTDNVNMN